MAIFSSWAGDFQFDSVGVRYGFSSSARTHDFRQADAFVDWKLPWEWEMKYDLFLRPGLGFTTGWLNDHESDAFIGSFGPNATFGRKGFPVMVVLGISPTWLTRTSFEKVNFRSPLQFTDHIGLQVRPGSHILMGYRLQHMSNAGLSYSNPGLNMHMFSLGYSF